MISFPDFSDNRPGRSMWPAKSPVALFAVNKERRLRPVAIQIDHKPGWKSSKLSQSIPYPLFRPFNILRSRTVKFQRSALSAY